ncbi:Flp pilus assembly protein CpaB [bacterium]|nr:Flp pilus assembly protein CpaB [bacterium]
MRLTRRVAIGIALVCGGLAAVLTMVYLKSMVPKKPLQPPPPTEREVVVPTVDIPASTIIASGMLTTRKVKVEEAPKSAPSSPAEVVGCVALVPLPSQRPIGMEQVARRGAGMGRLSGIVPPGMRAVTVAVDPVVGVAGLLKAGDRVDVIATFEVEQDTVARTILQDVELLALGTETSTTPTTEEVKGAEASGAAPQGQAGQGQGQQQGQPQGQQGQAQGQQQQPQGQPKSGSAPAGGGAEKKTLYPNATLAVSPEDAQKLIIADQRGDLRLALRPVGEHDFIPVPQQNLSSVAGPEYQRFLAQKKAAREQKPQPAAQQAPQPGQTMAPQGWTGTQPQQPTRSAPAAHKPQKRVPEVEIIRGNQSTTVAP